jgi:hypothetical protein
MTAIGGLVQAESMCGREEIPKLSPARVPAKAERPYPFGVAKPTKALLA